MAVIRWAGFAGENRALHPKLLPDNVGTGAACSSTLVRKLRADPPDYPGACRELLRWDKQAGQVLAGLTRRRQAEYQTCVGDAAIERSS